jgi:preprotein translocase subunit SecA
MYPTPEMRMLGPYLKENLANWSADFSHGDGISLFPTAVQGIAQAVLETLLTTACEHRGREPEKLEEEDLKHALLEHVARLDLDVEVRPFVPSLCRSYLEDLQRQGRLGIGQTLGRYVGALKEAFIAADRLRPQTFTRPGDKIGRNDLCPCGSGKKFKKCCQRE